MRAVVKNERASFVGSLYWSSGSFLDCSALADKKKRLNWRLVYPMTERKKPPATIQEAFCKIYWRT